VIKKVGGKGGSMDSKVEDVMEAPLPTVDRRTRLLDPAKLLKERNALVVVDGPQVVGILTTIDVINYLANR
jgi:predicted transcriptional regulator